MKDWLQNPPGPFALFKDWFDAAQKVNHFEPTSMTLATVDKEGMPSARVVLLKILDDKGFCFFTNYESRKGQELSAVQKAALVFHWEKPLHRQIRVRGVIEKLSYEESDQYFQSRPRGSQIGAWASPQSQPIKDREVLLNKTKEIEERFKNQKIPCPPHWGGFRLLPLQIEFWQAEEFRLHNRLAYHRDNMENDWAFEILAP